MVDNERKNFDLYCNTRMHSQRKLRDTAGGSDNTAVFVAETMRKLDVENFRPLSDAEEFNAKLCSSQPIE